MQNKEIRKTAKRKNVYMWEIAKGFGVSEFTFVRWMRSELPPEKKEKALELIDQIARQKGGAY